MNISIWSITYQHYDEIINQLLNTCIILVGGRSDLFNSGGGGQKGGKGYFSKRGELNKNYARIFLVSGRYISDPVKFVIVLFR